MSTTIPEVLEIAAANGGILTGSYVLVKTGWLARPAHDLDILVETPEACNAIVAKLPTWERIEYNNPDYDERLVQLHYKDFQVDIMLRSHDIAVDGAIPTGLGRYIRYSSVAEILQAKIKIAWQRSVLKGEVYEKHRDDILHIFGQLDGKTYQG